MRIGETVNKINTISNRIEKIRAKFCDGNNTIFAQMMDEKTNTTSGWIRGKRGIGINVIGKILQKFPTINPSWLLLEDGKMLKTDELDMYPPQAESESVSLLRTLLNEERSALKDMREKHEKLLVENALLRKENALLRKEIEDTKKINNKMGQSDNDGKHYPISHTELPEALPKLPVYTRN
jgi:hypothetical protein